MTWILILLIIVLLFFSTSDSIETYFNLEFFINENINYVVNLYLFDNDQPYPIIFNNIFQDSSNIIKQAIGKCEILNSMTVWNSTDKVFFTITALQNQFVKKYKILKTISTYLSLCNTYLISTKNMDNIILTDICTDSELIINQQICKDLRNYNNSVLINIEDYYEVMGIINYRLYIESMTKQGQSIREALYNSVWKQSYHRQYIDITNFEISTILTQLQQNVDGNTNLLLAIVTIVRDEAVFLPIWLKYYTSQVESQHIYIIDNDSSDGSTSDIPYHVIKASSEHYCSHEWILDTVQTVVTKLLSSGYDYVLFAEVDEFLIPSPTLYPGGLQEYVRRMKQPTVRATGYNLFHDYLNDPQPIDLSKPILSQRNVWYSDVYYSKNAITSIPLEWSVGFHVLKTKEYRNMIPDPNLSLLHLKKFDHQYFITRGHWKAIQDFNIYEYYDYSYSFSAHFVGNMLESYYWHSNRTEFDSAFAANVLSNNSNYSINYTQSYMYQNLHQVPYDFIHPFPLL